MARALDWVGFAVGYLLAYFVAGAVHLPVLWYYPLEHRWALETHPTGLAMDFMGRVLLALVCGGVFALVGHALRKRRFAERGAHLRPAAFWIAGLVLFTAGMFIYVLWYRLPIPLSLPHGYVAR